MLFCVLRDLPIRSDKGSLTVSSSSFILTVSFPTFRSMIQWVDFCVFYEEGIEVNFHINVCFKILCQKFFLSPLNRFGDMVGLFLDSFSNSSAFLYDTNAILSRFPQHQLSLEQVLWVLGLCSLSRPCDYSVSPASPIPQQRQSPPASDFSKAWWAWAGKAPYHQPTWGKQPKNTDSAFPWMQQIPSFIRI